MNKWNQRVHKIQLHNDTRRVTAFYAISYKPVLSTLDHRATEATSRYDISLDFY